MIIDDSIVQEVRNFIDLVKSEALIKAKQLESKLDAELNDRSAHHRENILKLDPGRRLQI